MSSASKSSVFYILPAMQRFALALAFLTSGYGRNPLSHGAQGNSIERFGATKAFAGLLLACGNATVGWRYAASNPQKDACGNARQLLPPRIQSRFHVRMTAYGRDAIPANLPHLDPNEEYELVPDATDVSKHPHGHPWSRHDKLQFERSPMQRQSELDGGVLGNNKEQLRVWKSHAVWFDDDFDDSIWPQWEQDERRERRMEGEEDSIEFLERVGLIFDYEDELAWNESRRHLRYEDQVEEEIDLDEEYQVETEYSAADMADFDLEEDDPYMQEVGSLDGVDPDVAYTGGEDFDMDAW